jgi:hypothetical protein
MKEFFEYDMVSGDNTTLELLLTYVSFLVVLQQLFHHL